MGRTKIEYVTDSWNPVVGCSHAGSPGCDNCYAARLAATRLKHHIAYRDLAHFDEGKPCWTGSVRMYPQVLEEPLKAKRPRRYLVCSMGDLFHESVGQDVLDCIFKVMGNAKEHRFLALTKRPDRMAQFCRSMERHRQETLFGALWPIVWPLPNVWLGVTVETQDQIWRVEELRKIPAAGHWVSLEPCLGPVKIPMSWLHPYDINHLQHIGLVVLGGETGSNARPMHPDWARKVRDDCVAAGVPFFFKGWGEWWTGERERTYDVANQLLWGDGLPLMRVGGKAAGRLLDGREWNQLPEQLILEGEN